MKKTLLILTLGLGTICLTSCSRGYGCPYTMETKIQNPEHELIKNTDAILVAEECETFESEMIAD